MEHEICISFYLREAAIRIHRKSLDGINNPFFVEFMINSEQKTFAVRSCKEKSLRSLRVRMNINSKTDKVEFYSLSLCKLISQLNDWDDKSSYRVYGKEYPEQELAIFNFSTSEIINENEVISC